MNMDRRRRDPVGLNNKEEPPRSPDLRTAPCDNQPLTHSDLPRIQYTKQASGAQADPL